MLLVWFGQNIGKFTVSRNNISAPRFQNLQWTSCQWTCQNYFLILFDEIRMVWKRIKMLYDMGFYNLSTNHQLAAPTNWQLWSDIPHLDLEWREKVLPIHHPKYMSCLSFWLHCIWYHCDCYNYTWRVILILTQLSSSSWLRVVQSHITLFINLFCPTRMNIKTFRNGKQDETPLKCWSRHK